MAGARKKAIMAGIMALPLVGGAGTSARAQAGPTTQTSQGSDGQGTATASATASPPPPAPPAPSAPGRRPPPPRPRRARIASSSGGPVATLPGFEMLADGASHLFVELTQNVQVEERRGQGEAKNRITYFLKGARVLHRNNENTLVTVFFNTPVDRARLQPTTGGLNFIVDLRTDVTPTWKLSPGKDSSAILEILFPSGDYLKNGSGAGTSSAGADGLAGASKDAQPSRPPTGSSPASR